MARLGPAGGLGTRGPSLHSVRHTTAGVRRHRWRRRHRCGHRRGARPSGLVRRHRRSPRHPGRDGNAPSAGGDYGRAHRCRWWIGSSLVSVGHRPGSTALLVRRAGGRAQGSRRRRERRRHHPPVLFRPRHRGRLACTAQRPPRGLPQRARGPRSRSWPLRVTAIFWASRPVRDGGRPSAGGYSAAKRAVAALTWQLGRQTPPGVTVNTAMSPIANTRMVAAALERARAAGRASGGGELSLDSIPGPENLGPLGAHLVGDEFGWCWARSSSPEASEVGVVDRPRLLEVVRTDGVASLDGVLQAVIPRAFVKAEAAQASDGGSNPRFGPIFDEPASAEASAAQAPISSCAVVSDRPTIATAITAALEAHSITCHRCRGSVRL